MIAKATLQSPTTGADADASYASKPNPLMSVSYANATEKTVLKKSQAAKETTLWFSAMLSHVKKS